jgi:hypothetical protein
VLLAALGVALVAAILVFQFWPPARGFLLDVLAQHPLKWPEVEQAPLTPPDGDPLPPGILVRLGRARLRQSGTPEALAFSPDNTLLASAEASRFTYPGPYVIHVWDVASGREVRRFETPPQRGVRRLLFAADGTLSELGDAGLCCWDPATGKEVRPPQRPWPADHDPQSVLSADGQTLLWQENKPPAHVYDAAAGREVRQLAVPPEEQLVGLTADCRTLVTACYQDGRVRLRDAATAKELQKVPVLGNAGMMLSFSDDGKTLAAGGIQRADALLGPGGRAGGAPARHPRAARGARGHPLAGRPDRGGRPLRRQAALVGRGDGPAAGRGPRPPVAGRAPGLLG